METAPSPDADLSKKQRSAFRTARKSAALLLKSRYRSLFLVREAYQKLVKHEGGMRGVWGEVRMLIRLVRAWARRDYTAIPWKPLLYATAALVYFVSPFDMIPDLLPGLGFVDDVAVVGAVVRAIQNELTLFEAWESGRAALSDPSA